MTVRDALPTPMKLLLVEGNDDKRFFEALMQHLRETDIAVEIYGGKQNLGNRLVNLVGRLNTFTDPHIGIVRDADDSSHSAFDSVAGSLRRAKLPTSDEPMTPVQQNGLRISVLILPPDKDMGELENVCLSSIEDTPDMRCVGSFFDCLSNIEPEITANQIAKARLHSYLAAGPVRATQNGEISRRQPGLRLGEAAEAGVWNWSSSAFDLIKDFLRNL